MKKFVVLFTLILSLGGCSSSSAFDAKEMAKKAQKNLNEMTPQQAMICRSEAPRYAQHIYLSYTSGAPRSEMVAAFKGKSQSIQDISRGIIDALYDAKKAGEVPKNAQEAAVLGVYICTIKLK